MNGTGHFREAEKYAAEAVGAFAEWDANEGEYAAEYDAAKWRQGQAVLHAILAAAVAVSNLVTVWGDIAGMMREDSELADTPPQRAEPLVTCNAAPADDGPERCGLPIGHEGMHEGNGVGWMTYVPPAYQTPAHSIYQSTATDLHMEMPR